MELVKYQKSDLCNKKRNTIFFLIIIVIINLGLCSCGKESVVKEVEALIDSIGTITLDSENTIIDAERHYDALTDNQKDEVENYYTLVTAREEYDTLVYESQTIKGVDQALYEKGYKLVELAFSEEYKKVYDRWIDEPAKSLESMKDFVKRMAETEDLILYLDTADMELNGIETKYVNVINLFLLGYPDYYILSGKMASGSNATLGSLLEVTVRVSEMIEQGELILSNQITTEEGLDEAYEEMYQYLN